MFATLQAEITNRILAADSFFRTTIMPLVTKVAVPTSSPTAATGKGLMFVELYAIYEYTVTNIVREGIAELKRHAIPLNIVRLELLGMILDPELAAVSTCGKDRVWETRMKLFQRVNAPDLATINDSFFPHDGSHYRIEQLQTIWDLFGITAGVLPDIRLKPLIGELVNHRNEIAHGRETARAVGGRYSITDILNRISGTQGLCVYLVSTMQSHCSVAANLHR